MNKTLLYIIGAFALVGCSQIDDTVNAGYDDAVEMTSVVLTSRASSGQNVAELQNYVGRKDFADKDTAVFTTIKRTNYPIDRFNYSDIEFLCSVTNTNGVIGTGWSRIPGKGTTADKDQTNTDRIYWSDATSEHTFIGYSVPKQRTGDFDWNMVEDTSLKTYFGSIGDPVENLDPDKVIDFNADDNVTLSENDILISYDTKIVANDAIAKLRFHHGLAQVRVIVNISDYAAGGGADIESVVSDMYLKNMLTMYKWDQMDTTTTKLWSGDQDKITPLYKGAAVSYDQKKNMRLWIPSPEGVGEGASRTFTFYGLAVPTTLEAGEMNFSFTVTYPDPMDPSTTKSEIYTASVPSSIKFSSGKCTTINVSLNHRNEKMTVGAEYMDWEFVDTPDQGSLKKNSTFLNTMAHDGETITIVGDAKATADDATWLYEKDGKVVDVYGNNGTATKPYTISTANQLLSFAYEVKAGRTFERQYVKLDADIHLQNTSTVDWIVKNSHLANPENRPTMLQWIGIGDATHSFNGTFIGGGRNITHLNGKAFFSNIGGYAIISELNLCDVVKVTDHGALAEDNGGFIYACRVEGDVESDNSVVGSLCGTNSGFIFACIHNGAVRGTKAGASVGGLVGTNTGKIAVSYHTGAIDGANTYGVVDAATGGSKIYACYFNSSLATPSHTVDPENVQGRTLGQMQSKSFANDDLNAKIAAISTDPDNKGLLDGLQDVQKAYFLGIINQYQYVFTPGAYPRVEKK